MPRRAKTVPFFPISVTIAEPSEELLREMCFYRLPHVIKRFPEYKPCSIHITKKDRFWRVNGRVTSRNVTAHILRTAGYAV